MSDSYQDDSMMTVLIAEWRRFKDLEAEAVENRRIIEDELTRRLKIDATVDSSKTIDPLGDGHYKVKVTTRLNHSIDSDKLQMVAYENDLHGQLSTLFRWKPEINSKAWKAADESITNTLAVAITTKAGRPSYQIETTNKEGK